MQDLILTSDFSISKPQVTSTPQNYILQIYFGLNNLWCPNMQDIAEQLFAEVYRLSNKCVAMKANFNQST